MQYIKNVDNKCNMTAWINTFAPESKSAISLIEIDLDVIQINKDELKSSGNSQS